MFLAFEIFFQWVMQATSKVMVAIFSVIIPALIAYFAWLYNDVLVTLMIGGVSSLYSAITESGALTPEGINSLVSSVDNSTNGFYSFTCTLIPVEDFWNAFVIYISYKTTLAMMHTAINFYKLLPFKAT